MEVSCLACGRVLPAGEVMLVVVCSMLHVCFQRVYRRLFVHRASLLDSSGFDSVAVKVPVSPYNLVQRVHVVLVCVTLRRGGGQENS